MNRFYLRKVRRYIIAAVMLIVAAYISLYIKDAVDAKNPEASLPIISVTTGYTVLPNVPRAGYEWRFGSKTVMSPFVSNLDVPLIAYDVAPDMPILVNFSAPAENIVIYQGVGMAATEFEEMRYNIKTPMQEGIYVYKVVADFKNGTIVHYFSLNVKNPTITF